MPVSCWHLLISGRVQGVWFRHNTHLTAHEIGDLYGWVRNLPDGRVEVLVQGPTEKVKALRDWCQQGPPLARVEHLETEEWPLQTHLTAFSVNT
jgi:acylphosphatase